MVYLALGFILGTILGSLAKAIADRSLAGKSFFGRSYCPRCKKKLRWYDLFPLLSFLVLRGRCRFCRSMIGFEYPAVEFVMGVAVAILFWQAGSNLPSLSDQYQLVNFSLGLVMKVFMATVLMILALTDLKETILPDRITVPAIVVVLFSLVSLIIYRVWYLYQGLQSSELGRYLLSRTDYFPRHILYAADSLLGGLVMASLIGLFFLTLILLTRGRGMGGGDLKFGVLLGLYFGYPDALAAIMLAFFLGSVAALGLVISGRRHFGQTVPFGPFLSLGALLALFWGREIINYYQNFNLLVNPLLPLLNQLHLK